MENDYDLLTREDLIELLDQAKDVIQFVTFERKRAERERDEARWMLSYAVKQNGPVKIYEGDIARQPNIGVMQWRDMSDMSITLAPTKEPTQ